MVNYLIEVSILSMLVAQILKIPFTYLITKKIQFKAMFHTGGMPSSHTALVTTFSTMIAFVYGVKSFFFALSFVVSLVVIYDSMNVRYEAGKHASILNKLLKEKMDVSEETEQHDPLKELLGHNPIQVFVGFIIGLIIGYSAIVFIV